MFELHITCTKDIDKIQIDFSDGSTCMTECSKKESKSKEQKVVKEKPKTSRDKISFDEEEIHDIIVDKPEVPDEPKEPNVEEYLQGLEF